MLISQRNMGRFEPNKTKREGKIEGSYWKGGDNFGGAKRVNLRGDA